MKKQIANILTSLRILSSIGLLFCSVFSVGFYILYLFCGLTDMIDGTIARWAHADGGFGARLDTAADLVFTAASLVKILPAIHLQKWLWIWAGLIAALRISCLILGFAARKKLVALHTTANKLTGLLLFLLPFTLPYMELQYSASVVCVAATAAAIQEGHYLSMGQEIV